MRNELSEAQLCAGCPNTGNYVGPVNDENINFYKTDPKYDAKKFIYPSVYLQDEYSMQSVVISGKGTTSINEAETKVANLRKGARIVLQHRIQNCSGYTATFYGSRVGVAEERHCPAVNTDVIEHLAADQ